jgi:simple sugar transport system ATP-binding protein
MTSNATLSLSRISKAFASTRALQNLQLDIHPGEVVALMGANGSGKSTLVRILSGVYRADSGEMQLRGKPYQPDSPRAARDLGVIAVHQIIADIGVPTLSVAENLCLDRLCGGGFPILTGKRALKREAQRIAQEIGLEVDLDTPLGNLSIAEQQLVAIARGVAAKPDLIIFDEPTASLSQDEAERLFQVINRLRDQNTAILYISHRIDDLRRLADRVVVLRDGRVIAEISRPIDFKAAITAMISRELSLSPANDDRKTSEVVLSAKNLTLKPGSASFDLSLRKGEIVAITGPVGSGKALLAETLAGIRRPYAGDIFVEDKACRLNAGAPQAFSEPAPTAPSPSSSCGSPSPRRDF